jgi:hypothetical protein
MNSLDPWRVIVTDSYGDVVLPPPYYGHPFYREVPSWIHYGDRGDTTRLLFDGAFIGSDPDQIGTNMTDNIGAELTALSMPGYPYGSFRPYPYGRVFFGAEAPSRERKGLTAEVAPVLAPATGGITVKKELDDKQVLHVEICVDGKCHKTSMDLAPAIAMVMQKLARWHEGMHAQMASELAAQLAAPQPPPSTVVSTVQNAVGAAEELIVGALIARHIDTVAAGFLGDIGGAVKSAARGISRGIGGGVAATFKKLRGPIGAAAGIAAAAGASAIPGVGPIAAPIAAKLANDLVQATAGDPKAKQAVAQASQQARTDPAVAAALDQATKAVANATAAHHVQDTAKKAAQGDSAAQQQIVQVADDAEKGDPAAKAVADLVANAMKSEWGAKLWEQATGRGPATSSLIPTTASGWYDVAIGRWYDVIGAALDDVRENARSYAVTKSGNAAVVVRTADGRLRGRGFRSLDEAIDALQRVASRRGTFTYAAAYEKAADGTAYIQDEEIGTAREVLTPATAIRRGVATTSG